MWLQAGDVLVTIAGRDTAAMTHKEAQQAILAAGDTVQLLAVSPKDGRLSDLGNGGIRTPHQPSFVTFLKY